MCNMVCQSMGRHVHIDYCRATADAPCRDVEIQHITTQMPPNPERPKDLITHSLFWRRSGMSLDEKNFSLSDISCHVGFKGASLVITCVTLLTYIQIRTPVRIKQPLQNGKRMS